MEGVGVRPVRASQGVVVAKVGSTLSKAAGGESHRVVNGVVVGDVLLGPVGVVVVARVGGIGRVPGEHVKGALQADGHVVLGQHVGREEVARHVRARLLVRGVLVGCRLRRADAGAHARVVRLLQRPHAHVRVQLVVAGGVDRVEDGWRPEEGVDAGVAEFNWLAEAGDVVVDARVLDADLVVAVGRGDDDLEVVAPLASVGGQGSVDVEAVESAANEGDGVRVLARGAGGVGSRVALVVDVETHAKGLVVAVVGARLSVVRIQALDGEIAHHLQRSLQVLKTIGLDVAGGNRCVCGSTCEGGIIDPSAGAASDNRSLSTLMSALLVSQLAIYSPRVCSAGSRRGGRTITLLKFALGSRFGIGGQARRSKRGIGAVGDSDARRSLGNGRRQVVGRGSRSLSRSHDTDVGRAQCRSGKRSNDRLRSCSNRLEGNLLPLLKRAGGSEAKGQRKKKSRTHREVMQKTN